MNTCGNEPKLWPFKRKDSLTGRYHSFLVEAETLIDAHGTAVRFDRSREVFAISKEDFLLMWYSRPSLYDEEFRKFELPFIQG